MERQGYGTAEETEGVTGTPATQRVLELTSLAVAWPPHFKSVEQLLPLGHSVLPCGDTVPLALELLSIF